MELQIRPSEHLSAPSDTWSAPAERADLGLGKRPTAVFCLKHETSRVPGGSTWDEPHHAAAVCLKLLGVCGRDEGERVSRCPGDPPPGTRPGLAHPGHPVVALRDQATPAVIQHVLAQPSRLQVQRDRAGPQ